MNKKLIVTLLSLMAALVFLTGAVGAAGRDPRPVIVFFYVDGLEAGQVEKETIKQQTVASFTKEYGGAYEVRLGDGYSGVGQFTDLANLDRFDLLPRLKADKVDYAVFYTLLPIRTKQEGVLQLPQSVSRVNVRVFNLRKDAYVADAHLSNSSEWAWPGQHCEKLFAEADSKVFRGLFAKGK